MRQTIQRGRKAVRLAKLTGDHARALRQVEDAEAGLSRVESEAESERRSAALAHGTEGLSEDEFEERLRVANERVVKARERLERRRQVADEVARTAADLSEEIARERIKRVVAEAEAAGEALAEAERIASKRREEHEEVERRRELTLHELRWPRAPFDPDHERRRQEVERQDDEQARWFARQWPQSYPERAPVVLHDRIAAKIEELVTAAEEERRRLREHPDAFHPDEGEVTWGEAFERADRLEDSGVPRTG